MTETCNGIQWIYTLFRDCIVDTRGKWSFAIGMLSNFIWIVADIPEIVVLCKTKDITGISPFLFIFFVIGDVSGLIGNILTGRMATQILTNFFYILFDSILLILYIHYKCRSKRNVDIDIDNNDVGEDSNSLIVAPAITAFSVAAAASVDYGLPYRGEYLIGSLFGWVSGCIYTISRIPQVVLNFKRKFVSNLSPFYFTCTVLGNTTYVLAIFIRDSSPQNLWLQSPFLIGALGPLCCDIITLFQMFIFGYSTAKEEADEADKLKLESVDSTSSTKASDSTKSSDSKTSETKSSD